MSDEHQAGDQIETEGEARGKGLTFVEIWLRKIGKSCSEEKAWREEAERAVEVYEAGEDSKTSFNIYHSNVETLLPALYNSTPVPDVRRRYGDADPVAKLVVDMTERGISYMLDQHDFDGEMRAIVRSAITAGRGVGRVRYNPQFVEQQGPEGPVEVKGRELVETEVVPWDRFRRGPGRRWADVPWIAFRHDLTREELNKLSPQIGPKVDVTSKQDEDDEDDDDDPKRGIFQTAPVWEIWDKDTKRVIFIADDYKTGPLKVEPDPLGLSWFFPTPRPLQQIEAVGDLTPVCPYTVYRPLIEELDAVTKRIRKLVAQLKVRGIIAADIAKDVETLRSAEDGQYIAANESASFVSSGGKLDNAIAHMPLEPTVKALQQLYIQRDAIKATIYEVTGLSDILRGASNADETATAQQIKSQWGSLRVQMMQREVQRFARDLFRMKTEIMARHFEPQNLIAMANFGDLKEDQQQALPQVIQLFKSDSRGFRVDVETDSTIRADLSRNQEQMNNFLQGTGQFVQGMMGAAQLMPALLPTMTEVYTAFARNFSLGKQAEDALDQLSQMAPKMAAAAEQSAGQDPEAEKMKMQMQFEQQKFELEKQKMGMDLQMKQADLQVKRAEMEMKQQSLQLDFEAKAADVQVKRQMSEMDMQGRQMEMQFGAQKHEQEFGHKQRLAETEFGHKARLADMEMSSKREADTIDRAKRTRDAGLEVAPSGDVQINDPYKEALSGLIAQIGEMVQASSQQNAQVLDTMRQTMQLLAESTAASSKPKRMRIVRGPDGKAIGAEVG